MIAVVLIAAGVILVGGLLFVLYSATQHSKSDETGRRTEAAPERSAPARTEGRET